MKNKSSFRYYTRDKEHKLKNATHVDNSYKWAGGGFLSTVGDLLQFGNAMLYSFQQQKQQQQVDSRVELDAKLDQSTATQQVKPQEVAYTPGPFSAINVR
jgi:hypothetical protein